MHKISDPAAYAQREYQKAAAVIAEAKRLPNTCDAIDFLSNHYELLPRPARDVFVVALIGDIAAEEALARVRNGAAGEGGHRGEPVL